MDDERQLTPLELANLAAPIYAARFLACDHKEHIVETELHAFMRQATGEAKRLYHIAATKTDGKRD